MTANERSSLNRLVGIVANRCPVRQVQSGAKARWRSALEGWSRLSPFVEQGGGAWIGRHWGTRPQTVQT
jgi:hypothetical protein